VLGGSCKGTFKREIKDKTNKNIKRIESCDERLI
jgi:hypothetical protein